jgi:hypothetical protein
MSFLQMASHINGTTSALHLSKWGPANFLFVLEPQSFWPASLVVEFIDMNQDAQPLNSLISQFMKIVIVDTKNM